MTTETMSVTACRRSGQHNDAKDMQGRCEDCGHKDSPNERWLAAQPAATSIAKLREHGFL